MSGIENGNRAFRLVHLRACLALLLPALGASLLAAFLGGWAAAAEERSAARAVPLDAVKTAPAEQSVPSIDSSAKAPATPPLIRPNTSQYWIGVVTQSPIPEPLRVHLGLKEDQGIMVVDVAPRSPAAAAPLLRYDLLLKADGKALTKADDLLAALDAGQGRKMDLELMRGGQRTHLEITPAKRPPEARPGADLWPAEASEGPEWAQLRWLLQEIERQQGRPFRLRVSRPGVLLPPGVDLPDATPDDLAVTITKKGKQPAQVVVTRGGQRWETTEDKLATLPAEVRPHVERLLGHYTIGAGQPGTVDLLPAPSSDPEPAAAGPGVSEKLIERLDQSVRETERLLEALKAEHQRRPEQAPPSPSAEPDPR